MLMRKRLLLNNKYLEISYFQRKLIQSSSRYRFGKFRAVTRPLGNSSSRIRDKGILLGGILSWLGFKEKEEEEEDPLISIMKLAILNMQREEHEKAESILHLALKLAQERADPEAQRYVYDLLANNAYQKGEFEKAEKLFIQVMKELLSSGMSSNDNALVEISLKLAAIYSKQKQWEKAETGFRFCLDTQEKKLNSINLSDTESLTDLDKDNILLWAMSADWYAKYLLDSGKYTEAQKYFERALNISEKINGPSHPQTLVLLNDVGSVASLRKDFEKAVEYFKKAISRGTVNETPDLPSFYCNLGATYLKKGDYKSATASCTRAFKLAKKLKNEEAEKDAKECLEELKAVS